MFQFEQRATEIFWDDIHKYHTVFLQLLHDYFLVCLCFLIWLVNQVSSIDTFINNLIPHGVTLGYYSVLGFQKNWSRKQTSALGGLSRQRAETGCGGEGLEWKVSASCKDEQRPTFLEEEVITERKGAELSKMHRIEGVCSCGCWEPESRTISGVKSCVVGSLTGPGWQECEPEAVGLPATERQLFPLLTLGLSLGWHSCPGLNLIWQNNEKYYFLQFSPDARETVKINEKFKDSQRNH